MQQDDSTLRRASSVLIIDDHDIVRFALAMLVQSCPELQLAGSADTLSHGLAMIAQTQPDLVISDLGTGDSSGLDTVRALVAAQAPRPVLIVSVHDEMLYGEQAIALGARGYVMKDSAYGSVIPAALNVLRGGVWASPRLNARLISRIVRSSRTFSGGAADPKALSERELKVLELLRSGKSTKEIAKTLDMSIRTVDIHRARIKRKLGLRTGAELIAFASSRL
jgi:DNA-binding NarL/FixJ family response regulator